MDKKTIYEEFFNVVDESTEWGVDADSSKYGYYIDGLTDMVRALLEKFDKKDIEES